jgi:DNA-binding PadR family transcriptional regulator
MTRRLLTDFEIMILLAIMRVGNDAYGVTIAREIETTAGRAVQLPAVYHALGRLEQQGLVRSWVGEATAQRGGRAKKHFALTRAGHGSVQDTRDALTALWTEVPELT